MTNFASKTKNVHRELKDTLGKTEMLINQYAKVKVKGTGERSKSSKEDTSSGTLMEPVSRDSRSMDLQVQIKDTLMEIQQTQRAQYEQLQVQLNTQAETIRDLTKKVQSCRCASSNEEQSKEYQEEQRPQQQMGRKQSRTQEQKKPKDPKLTQQQEKSQEEEQQTHEDNPSNPEGPWTAVAGRKPRNKIKMTQEAVIVKVPESSTYANVLREVKRSLGSAGLTCEIDTARKTHNCSLLLRMRKQTTKTVQVSEITRQSAGTEAHIKTNAIAVEIRELDEDITKEDLASYLSVNLSTTVQIDKILTLKPGLNGKLMAVVLHPASEASRLVNGPRIKIGWSVCRVKARVPVIRCFKCLDFGHRKTTCTGPDRSDRCTNCWEAGHQSKNCEAEAHCGLCEEEDNKEAGKHFSGGGRCQAFKRFLQKKNSK